MAVGVVIQGVRWIVDAAGRLVGYRNPITDKDEDANLPGMNDAAGGGAYTWANRPAAASAGNGAEIVISDVGNVGRTRWRSNGTIWQPAGIQDLWIDTTASSNTSSTTEGLLKQYSVPAGLLTGCRYFVIKALYTKSGTSETATFRARLGTAGTTGDQAIITNNSTLASTNRAATVEGSFFASSATQLRGLGRDSSFGAGAFFASSTTSVPPTNATIPNMDSNALTLSLTLAMNTGVETGNIVHVVITAY